MSASASKSTADSTSTTVDSKVTAGDESIIAKDNSNILIQTLDPEIIAEALGVTADAVADSLKRMESIASGTNEGVFALGEMLIDANKSLSRQTMDMVSETNEGVFNLGELLIKTNADLSSQTVDTLKEQAQSFNTTLRDTLSATLKADNLAGSAEQSGSAAGWVSRNPVVAAGIGVGGMFLLTLLVNRKK